MNWLVNIIFQFFLCIFVIVVGHYLYNSIKSNYSKKVIKDVYHTQVEKYKDLIHEIQRNEPSQETMEDELTKFLEQSINEKN
jgi:F0F1-type ATP synthase alpha subunit